MEQILESKSIMDDLLAFLDNEEEQVLQIEEKEGFRIEDINQANYFARKLREIREEKAQAEAAAEAQLEAYQERVSKWLDSVSKPLVAQEDRILSMLEDFAATQLEGSTKRSMKLIEGTLQFKKQQPKYEYEDETLLEYVKQNAPDLVNEKVVVTTSVDKTALKKKAQVKNGKAFLGGKEIKGITIIDLPDKFDVK